MRSKYVAAGLSAVFGAVVGSFVTAELSKRYFETQFEQRLAEELEATRRHYAVMSKQGDWDDPEDLAEKLGLAPEEPAETVKEAVEKITPYHKVSPAPEGTVEVTKNVFTNARVPKEWDQDEEERTRSAYIPYVISEEEYSNNLPSHEQISLQWYEEDQTLCEFNNATEIIVDLDGTVGGPNLERFGDGSGSDDVVFVRNEVRGTDYEILRDPGSYAHDVMGMPILEHSDDYGPRVRKFREYDE